MTFFLAPNKGSKDGSPPHVLKFRGGTVWNSSFLDSNSQAVSCQHGMVEAFFCCPAMCVPSFCGPWFKGFKGWRNWKLKVRTFKFDLCFDFFQVFDEVSKTAEKQALFRVPSWKQKVWNGESSVWVGYGAMKWSWFRSNMESSKLKNRDSTLRVPKLNPNRYLGIHSDPMV